MTQTTQIYQFTHHQNLPPNSPMPQCRMFDLFQKLERKERITREEKNFIANSLYGTFGSKSSTYKLGGFAAPFHKVLPRFLVKQYDYWQECYAPDKTSLRSALFGTVKEIIQA